ncbi:exopolysaccharide transport family protein [Bradyrhizobium sp. SZCCHNS3004]|uniref:GumC family protein n=1 Tax=Bradyrhizobium sp. SZCCHNS3004 TaxID=3057312 RepID=UPI002915DBA7|nr:exopolysaccharide transport family protein [Bradyrhizobium sp. SZCCHNS3004]
MSHASRSDSLAGLAIAGTVWRRRRVFGAVFAAILGLAVLALVLLPVRYLGTASVIVAEQEPGAAANASSAWAQKVGDPADMESQLLVIRSPRLLLLVMSTPGVIPAVVEECERGRLLGGAGSCDKLKTDAGAFIEHVDGRFSVASAGRSRVINISYQSGIPEVAQTLANALTQAFLDDQRNEGANSREVASSWIWRELKQLDQQLRAADEKIQQFRRTKGLMRGANAPISSERLTSIGQQLSQAEAARAEAAARLQEIKSEQERGPTDAPSVLSSRTIADLKQQLTAVSAQLASAATMLGPKHPSMLALSREQAMIQQRLVEEMQNIAASAKKAYDANDALVNSLKTQMDAAKAEAGSATLDEASIESMVRDTEIKRQQYAELYKKASELETERRVLQGSTRLVSLAELPNKPFFPKKIPFLAAGTTLALIFGIGAAMLADKLSRSATGEAAPQSAQPVAPQPMPPSAPAVAEIEQAPALAPQSVEQTPDPPIAEVPRSQLPKIADVPILACLPRLKTLRQLSAVGAILQDYRNLALPQVLRLASEDAEFQAGMRALVQALGLVESGPTRRIVVTSAGDGEGKTTCVLSLAEHLAAAGRRVLMVECEPVHPDFAQVLSLPASPGLSGVLSGAAAVSQAVIRTDRPNLHVLPFGERTGRVASVLFGAKIAELLSGLGDYDAVLIDSPLPALESLCLSKIDNLLLCVRSDRSVIEPVISAITRVKLLGADDLAIVVTMTDAEHGGRPQPAFTATDAYARAG